jgi:hypothetical protein
LRDGEGGSGWKFALSFFLRLASFQETTNVERREGQVNFDFGLFVCLLMRRAFAAVVAFVLLSHRTKQEKSKNYESEMGGRGRAQRSVEKKNQPKYVVQFMIDEEVDEEEAEGSVTMRP